MEKPPESDLSSLLAETTPLANSPATATGLYPGLILADILRLESLLGKGGMGEVWRATHLLLNEPRAVKLILAAHSNELKVRDRFIYGEARNALRLNHPNIVRTYDLGQFSGSPYIVMEFVEGQDLRAVLKTQTRFTPQQTGVMLEQIAPALDSAHRQGLVHRDLKPANILLTKTGITKISDFGLVKDLTLERSDLTLSGYGLGTPLYMAPEQAQGNATIASDIYSLGVLLYEMLTGRLPFTGPIQALLIQHASALPTPPHQLDPDISPAISTVILQALAKNPADRFTSAPALAEAYRLALGGGILEETTPLTITFRGPRPAKPVAPPGGTHTFLFTDIEGSTKLWEHHPDQMPLALARHDQILRAAIEDNGGYVFKMIGDAFNAVFTTALDALKAAVQAQRDLATEAWPPEIGIVKVRMALHHCYAENRNGDFVSPNLNRIARLMAVAYGGQVLMSSLTAQIIRAKLPEGVSLRDLGLKRLKDLVEPEQIYQVCVTGLVQDFPPLRTVEAIPHNLPFELNELIGRHNELNELGRLLRNPRVRLVTLTGVGGTGKTRLSLGVAQTVLADFPDGVWFVELENVTERPTLIGELAAILDLKETAGQTLLEQLKIWLTDKKILLVLDNFEQLVERGAVVLPELLKASPNLKILVTSREILRLSAEREYQLEPLALPQSGKVTLTPHSLMEYPAVALFVARAQAVKADFSLTEENAATIVEICQRLDGLPLAIELAAPRVRLLTPAKLLERLSDRLKILTGGARDLPPRQQTLRATIDWSYDLLEPAEQQLFNQLSIFAGGCTPESAEAVCNAQGKLEFEIIDGLEALVNKSLLKQREDANGEIRFSMLPTIREYGLKKLVGEEMAWLSDHHAAYFMRLAEELEPKLRLKEEVKILIRLESEYDNLRTALEWLIGKGKGESSPALKLAGALGTFWELRGYHSQGRRYLERVLSLGGDEVKASVERAKALNAAAKLATWQGDYASARQLLEESLAIRRQLGDKPGISTSLNSLGIIADSQGDFASARQLYEESLAIRRQIGDKRTIANSLNNLGIVAKKQGDYALARQLYEESLAIRRQIANKGAVADSLTNLGTVVEAQGDYAEARQLYEESLAIFRESDDKYSIGIALNNLGNVAIAQGDYARASQLYEQSLSMRREVGDKAGVATSLHNLGDVARGKGDYPVARQFYEEGLAIRRQIGNKHGVAETLSSLSWLALQQADYAQAHQFSQESLALAQEIGSKREIATSLINLGWLALQAGDYDSASRLFMESLRLNQAMGRKQEFGAVYNYLGLTAYRQGHYTEARDYFAKSLALCHEISYQEGLLYSFAELAEMHAIHLGNLVVAARLAGIVEGLRLTMGIVLEPVLTKIYDNAVTSARTGLSQEAYDTAFAEGQADSLDEAVEYALHLNYSQS